MLATGATIFRNSCFQRTPLTGCHCILLSVLNQNLQCSRILQIILLILLKTPNQEHLKRTLNSNILCNLKFAIFDFIMYKTLVYSVRFPYSSFMRTKQNKVCLFDLLPLLFFASFMKNQHHDFFSYDDTDHFPLSENNFSLSQFL